MRENLTLLHSNNKGADQPVHPRSLISTFVIQYLGRIVSILTTIEISVFVLVSVVQQGGLNFTWSETPKTGFLASRLISKELLHER